MAHYCRLLLLCNTTTKEDENTLPSSFYSQTQRRQNTQFFFKKNEKKGGNLFSSSHSALSLLAPTFPLLFPTLSPSTFFFSSRKKEKKTIEKKKNVEKGRSFPLSSYSALSLCAFVFALLLLPFCFKHFLLASSSFQVKEGKKTMKKKP